MIDRQHGDIIFECDSCGDTLESDTGNFESAINIIRREGWKASKVGSDWIHTCHKCQRK